MEIENATFRSWTEFQRWKEEEEANNHVYFCKPYGNTSTNITEISYYMCQRDGPNRQHRKSGDIPKTTRKNKKGVSKSGLVCPARMIVTEIKGDNGSVSVRYTKTRNHPITVADIQHHPMPLAERENIRTKLSLGIPAEKIYQDFREGHGSREKREDDFTINKKHLINKRQIKEIERKLKVNRRLHPDGALSVNTIVQKLRQEKYDGVLLYKPHGGKAFVGPNLFEDDLFLLGYMSKQQGEMFRQNASKIVFVDSTHETNQYKFKLVTALVPDEFGKSYPVAHLITNRRYKRDDDI